MMNNQDGPERFGDYYLVDKIAVGGMAEIWRAKTIGVEGFERVVAIKCILPSYTQNPEFNSMFIDEARIASTMTHSNIVRITNFGVIDNKYYHEMEFVEGRNLRQILQKCKEDHVVFPVDSACYIMSEICKGLHYAHTKHDSVTNEPLNIIHRDMSPQNIMVSFEGEVKVIDWGIAKAKGKIEETRAGVLKGKFGYMSPEQAEGEELDLRTDIFSIGIVLYELATGERLFVADSEINTLKKIKEGVIPLPSRVSQEVDKELEAIILKALARPRIERYQTCYDLHDDLVKYLHKKFPAYNSLKLSKFIKELFSNEIIADRKRIHEREQSVPSYSSTSSSGRINGDRTRISSSTGTGAQQEGSFPSSVSRSRSKSYEQNEPDRTQLADSSKSIGSGSVSMPEHEEATVTVAADSEEASYKASGYELEQKSESSHHMPFKKRLIRPKVLVLSIIMLGVLFYLVFGGEEKKHPAATKAEQLPPTEQAAQEKEVKEMAALQKEEGAPVQGQETKPQVQQAQTSQPQVQQPQVQQPQTQPQEAQQAQVQTPQVQTVKTTEPQPKPQTQPQPQVQEQQVVAIRPASLSLTTTPVPSEVIIDGVSKGQTPVTLNDLSTGKKYELILKARGFEPVTKYFTLRKENNNLVLPLTPIAGAGVSYLSLEIEPPVLVYVDGRLVSNYKSLYMYQVDPGLHMVRFVNEKMRIDHTMKISVAKGDHVKKNITLR